MIRNHIWVVIALVGFAAAASCGGQSVSIGGDPSGGGPVREHFTGGAAITGGATTGGAFPTGGISGTGFGATGGVTGSGGSIILTGGTASGGTNGVNGGSSTIPTPGGTGGTGFAEGGEGSVGGDIDYYPRVSWQNGEGYRECPIWGNVWDFECWNSSGGGSECTQHGGAAYCNTCSCSIPCLSWQDCPGALTGQRPVCLPSGGRTIRNSCFVLCENQTGCPTGMTCLPYAYDTSKNVCAWVDDRVQ